MCDLATRSILSFRVSTNRPIETNLLKIERFPSLLIALKRAAKHGEGTKLILFAAEMLHSIIFEVPLKLPRIWVHLLPPCQRCVECPRNVCLWDEHERKKQRATRASTWAAKHHVSVTTLFASFMSLFVVAKITQTLRLALNARDGIPVCQQRTCWYEEHAVHQYFHSFGGVKLILLN